MGAIADIIESNQRSRMLREIDEWMDDEKRSLLSRTWKERHAKGVPVKMSLLDWRKCVNDNRKILNHRPGHSYEDSTVTVHVSDWADETGPEAVFCSFRYKQSWLEKKKVITCGNRGCGITGCGKYPDCNTGDHNRGELWNSKPMGGVSEW